MTIQSRATKNLIAGLGAALIALSMAQPAQAQYRWESDDDDWRPRRERPIVIDRSPRASTFDVDDFDDEEPVIRRPIVERREIIKRRVEEPVIERTVVVQPVVRRTVVVEKPIVQREIHRTIVKRPIYTTRVVQRPLHVRHAAFERRYKPRCYLPEREFCR